MKAEVVTITPAMAEEMLKGNKSNRPVLQKHVKFLAQQMLSGVWKTNGEAIKLSGSNLLDGQHRLMACVRSEMPFTTLIVRDVNSDVFDTLDTGKLRSASDVLAINGAINTRLVASAIRAIYLIRAKKLYNSVRTTTNAEVLLFAQTNPGIHESAQAVNTMQTAKRLLSGAQAAALHYEFGLRDPQRRDRYFNALETGLGLDATNSVYMLRERLVDNGMNKAKLRPIDILAYAIKAWNAMNTTTMKRLSWHVKKGEAFPTIAD